MHKATLGQGLTQKAVIVAAVLAGALLQACSDRTPTTTLTSAPTPRRIAAGTVLHSSSLYIPANNGVCTKGEDGQTWCQGAMPWTTIELSELPPPGQWSVIRVSGAIHVDVNPALSAYQCRPTRTFACWDGGWPLGGQDIGPAGTFIPGYDPPVLNVSVVAGDRYLPARAPQADVMQMLLWDRVFRFRVSREGTPSGFSPCDFCAYVPAYLFSGSQSIEIRTIDPPASIVSTPSGDSVQFAAQSSYGLSETSWHYVEGDTEATPGWNGLEFTADRRFWEPYEIFADSIRGCTGKLECTYQPKLSGRMYLKATLTDGDGAVALPAVFAGEIVRKDNQVPKLVLACSPGTTVMRGDSIACVARSQPSGAVITELAWAFQDSAGQTITAPAGTDTVWAGRMAVGGKVKVSGKVNGTASADSLPITVTGRSWPRLHVDAREAGHGDLPPPATVAADSEMAHTHVDFPMPPPVHEIRNGPNTGWAFVDSLPAVPVTTHINDAWQPGSVWYQLQHQSFWQLDPNGNPLYYCSQNQIPQLLTLTRKHEGAALTQHNSHVDVFRQWASHHNAQNQIEAAVVYVPTLAGVTTLADWFRFQVWGAFVYTPMMGDPNQHHTSDSPPGIVPDALFPCKPRY